MCHHKTREVYSILSIQNYIICVLCFVFVFWARVDVETSLGGGDCGLWGESVLKPSTVIVLSNHHHQPASQHGPRAESGIANNLHGECRDCRDCRESRDRGWVIPDPICWNKLILSASSFLSDPSRWFSYMPRPGYRLYALCFDIKLHIYLTSLKH